MKKIINVICMLLIGAAMFAQNNFKLSGVVKDSKGQPVIGAVVMLEGNTSVGTVTDADGRYSLSLPSGKSRINVNCISFKTQILDVAGRAVIDIILEDDAELLDEVVVVGYGSMRRSDLTGSVTSIKVDEDEAARSSSIDQLLQGHAAGVQVTNNGASPDGGVAIRIRGLSSFTSGASEPLYVIDGVIIDGASKSVNLMSHGSSENSNIEETNGLMGINPQDIASMEILKDASATAIYGAQGANGVVLITTKGASKEKPTIRASVGMDVSTNYRQLPMLSFDEYVDYLVDSGKSISHIYSDTANREGLLVNPMNWQDYTMRTAVSQRYYLSISGRPKTVSYMFSLGYNNKNGIIRNTGVEQYTMRLNLDKNISKTFKVGTRTGISYINSNMTSGANANRNNAAGSLIRSMLTYRPFMKLDGDEEEDPDVDEETFVSGPDKWLKYFINKRETLRITPSIYLQWQIVPWLTFKSTLGGDYSSAEFTRWKSRVISSLTGSIGSTNHFDNFRYNWDNLLMFNKKFGSHNLSGTVGMTTSSINNASQYVEGWFIGQDRGLIKSMNSAVAPYTAIGYSENASGLMSFFVRAIYNYRERYVLTATYRFDGSSKFQGANKWAQFPSFAFAWRLNQEPWFDVPVISSAKVRLGWGRVGNQSIGAYKTLATYGSLRVADHTLNNMSMTQIGLYPDILANPSLKWETTEQFNAGIDLGLWKGRLSLSVDLYNKMTKDLLQTINISKSSGFTTMPVNTGSVLNRGIEITVDATPVKTRNLEWNVNGNFSLNRGKIVQIGEGQNYGKIWLEPGKSIETNYFYGSTLRSTPSSLGVINWFIEGQPIGLFYGFKTEGIAQTDGDGVRVGETGADVKPGDLKYVDVNGNGWIDDDDRTIIGDPNPDFTYGFGTSLTWKKLTLSVNFNGSFGNDIYNLNNWEEFQTAVSATATAKNIVREAYVNAWNAETGGTFPRLGYSDADRFSDLAVEDGSYLRLANVSLSYNIPFKKSFFVKSINVGVSANNLIFWTKYKGWDPDVNSFGSDIKRMGVDMGSYPSARTFSFDLKFTF